MDESDFEAFAEAYGAAWDFHRQLSDRALVQAFRALARYPLAVVLGGIDAHCADRQRGQYPPKPADIIDQIERRNPASHRPGADEMWARVPRSDDDTVVWTEEAARAWAIASALVNPYLVARPDWVAARMAFRDAYQREVERAQLARLPVCWVVSPGNDRRLLMQTVQDAVRDGLLTASAGAPYLVGHAAEGSLVPLIEGAKASGNERALSALAELRLRLTRPPTADYDLDAVRAACAVRDLDQAWSTCRGADDDRRTAAG